MKFTPAAVVAFLALWESTLAGGIEVRTHPVTPSLTLALIARQLTIYRNVNLVSSTISRSGTRPLPYTIFPRPRPLLRSPLALAALHLRVSPLHPRANKTSRSRLPVSLFLRSRPLRSKLLRSKLPRSRLPRSRLLQSKFSRPLRSRSSKLLRNRLLRSRLLRNRPLRNKPLRNRPLRSRPLQSRPRRRRLLFQPRSTTTSLQRPRTRKLSRLQNPSRP